uniref:Uncharacterized protein n=1 Tax=Ananas comosus var. bracteatus TaxID=296719 RepID=A0A6V7NT55_ANACO|nr:unnamed protein product [Ananas comosus var. bracteatus]
MLVRVAPYKPALRSWPTRLMLTRASLPRRERLGTVGRALLQASSLASDELIGGLPLDFFILERLRAVPVRLICADIWRVWARYREGPCRSRGVTVEPIGNKKNKKERKEKKWKERKEKKKEIKKKALDTFVSLSSSHWCHAPGPIPIWAGPSTSNRRRTDRVSPIRPRLITRTNSNKKCTSGNIQKRLTRG